MKIRISLVIVMGLISPSYAVPMPPVPLEPLYFEPPVESANNEIRQQSCTELDNAIRYLQPYRYSYKAEFHQDNINAAAISSFATFNGILTIGYLTYSSLVEEKEHRRILEVEQKISMFQQVKAEKHCFE